MENIIYRKYDTDSALKRDWHKLEFYCCQTNEVKPYREILELGLVITNEHNLQIDFSLDEKETRHLINYLQQLLSHMEEFNKNSKPKENEL